MQEDRRFRPETGHQCHAPGKFLPDHVGEKGAATKVRDAVAAVIQEGKVRTYDMMRIPGGPDAVSKGAATTTQMTDAVLAKLG